MSRAARAATLAGRWSNTRATRTTQVAEVASWVLFMWLFALMAHDGLSNVHPLLWGCPLVFSLFYLIGFTAYECYKDFKALKAALLQVELEEVTNAEEVSVELVEVTDAEEETNAEEVSTSQMEVKVEEVTSSGRGEPSQFDLAVMLCNYKDEGDDSGEGASTETALSAPPPPQSEGSTHVDEGNVHHW